MSFKEKRFVFAGNRFFVLGEMIRLGLNVVEIYVLKGSYLEKELKKKGIDYRHIPPKKDLVTQLKMLGFDFFISNGLPVILPIAKLKSDSTKQFINIHPSLLPDLRGMDPVPGSLLHGRDSGATCHIMDDGIDTGGIVAQVPIKNNSGIDVKLLYQLSFKAEVEAFKRAYQLDFEVQKEQRAKGDKIYYSFSDSDLYFNMDDTDEQIMNTVRAFNNENKLARCVLNGVQVRVRSARCFPASDFELLFEEADLHQVVLVYNNSILIKRSTSFLLLEGLDENAAFITLNQILK